MTISEVRKNYVDSSTKASDINRKLIFAGIAIVWIFRNTSEVSAENVFPEDLKPILLLFCISLCMDIFQYIVRAVVWHIYYHLHRVPEEKEETTQAKEPEWLNSFSDTLFYSKFIPTIIAYLNLSNHLSITALQDSAVLLKFSGWSICYALGLVFGILMIWYVITDLILQRKKIETSSTLCKCTRLVIGISMIVVFGLKIFFVLQS